MYFSPTWIARQWCYTPPMKAGCVISSGVSSAILVPALLLLVISVVVPSQGLPQGSIDLQGKPSDPFQEARGKIVVLLFVRTDCPISNRYAPVIQEMSARYKAKATFFLVYPIKSDKVEQIQNHLNAFGYHLRAIRDPESVLVKESEVTVTPEAAVYSPERRLLYHGRIDDWYQDFGRSRQAPTTHDLSDAIASAIAGKPPANSTQPAVGCYLPEKP
jgi:thiol-disulfide isomerase/thioredoxin